MAPAVYLLLSLLFFPTVILADPFHIPVVRRRQANTARDWHQEANRLRARYGYATLPSPRSHPSNRRTVSGIPVLDQVNIVIVFFYIDSS